MKSQEWTQNGEEKSPKATKEIEQIHHLIGQLWGHKDAAEVVLIVQDLNFPPILELIAHQLPTKMSLKNGVHGAAAAPAAVQRQALAVPFLSCGVYKNQSKARQIPLI